LDVCPAELGRKELEECNAKLAVGELTKLETYEGILDWLRQVLPIILVELQASLEKRIVVEVEFNTCLELGASIGDRHIHLLFIPERLLYQGLPPFSCFLDVHPEKI
jgi:hypothetical protein